MNVKQKILLPVAAIVGLLLMVVYMAGGFSDKQAPASVPGQAYTGQTAVIKAQAITQMSNLPATLIAKQNTRVASRILATVKQVKVRAGDYVSSGQELVLLDNQDLQAQVKQYQGQLDAVAAQLAQAKLQLERNRKLRAQGLVSISDLDTAQANYDQLLATNSATEQMRDQAKVALTYSVITSPIAGRVVDRMVEPGDTVSPGQGVVAIYNPTSIQLKSAIPESQAISLSLGDTVEYQIDSLALTGTAKVSEIIPLADSAARSFEIKLDIPEQGKLMPGMFARIKLATKSKQQVVIPNQAIHTFGQLTKVYVVNNGQLEARFIRLGEAIDAEHTVVLSGLKVGDKVKI